MLPITKNETINIVSFASQNGERQAELQDGVEQVLRGRPYLLHFAKDDEDAAAAVANAHILLTWGPRLTEAILAAAPKLKWAHIGDAGVEKCLFPAMVASPVVLTNSSGIHGQFMAEWTLAALFYISQGLSEAEAWRRDRDWKLHKDNLTRNRFALEGKRALIVGYGSIGKAVAANLKAVGIACEGIVSRFRPAEIALHVTKKLPEIIGYFDIVVIALPITSETDKLFDDDLLRRMKSGSILLNLARGKIIDEIALTAALRNGPLDWVATDVFTHEPLPADSPLFTFPNLLMTPHIAGNFPEYTQKVQTLFLENLQRFLSGKPLANVVDKARGY